MTRRERAGGGGAVDRRRMVGLKSYSHNVDYSNIENAAGRHSAPASPEFSSSVDQFEGQCVNSEKRRD